MYLIRIEMPLQSKEVMNCLRDAQQMHQLITRIFDSPQNKNHILYRLTVRQMRLMVYVYSDVPVSKNVDYVKVTGQKDISDYIDQFENDDVLGFNLCACPSKKQKEDGKKNSRRLLLRSLDERLEWLRRKAHQNGFKIIDVMEQSQIHNYARHSKDKGGKMFVSGYEYQGTLKVSNADLFKQALQKGIGTGKAYGLGMLLVRKYAESSRTSEADG